MTANIAMLIVSAGCAVFAFLYLYAAFAAWALGARWELLYPLSIALVAAVGAYWFFPLSFQWSFR